MTDNEVSLVVPPMPAGENKKSSPNLRPLSINLRRLSAISASGVPIKIAVKSKKAKKPNKKGKEKNEKKLLPKRSKPAKGAIILSLLIAIVASVLAAWLLVQVKRLDEKMTGQIKELNEKAEVVANSLIKDCAFGKPWKRTHGVTKVFPVPYPLGINVYCDQITDGGGWTVFQRRLDGSVNFYRNWKDYESGFGSLNGEFWMGLEKLYDFTTNSGARYELRIDLADFEGEKRYAKYKNFRIGGPESAYDLHVSGYVGDAGDAFKYHNGMKFSTPDKDNDQNQSNCAERHHAAWWFKACHASNLNGKYQGGNHKSYADGVNWRFWRGDRYSLKSVEMKIRRKL